VITLLSAALLSALLVWVVRWDALRRGVIDEPSHRSSHQEPTPRGGGVGLLLALGAVLSVRGLGELTPDWVLAVLGVSVVAIVGWIDDHGPLRARLRLTVHVLGGVLFLPVIGAATLPLPLGVVGPAIWVFWTVSAVNVVNFIDGIDGIIALQGVTFAAFCAVAAAPGGLAEGYALALTGACIGFLVWNWNPARIFLGDVGSGALGALFVLGGGLIVLEGEVTFVAVFAPLIPIFLDATVTLLRRARAGERLAKPHRKHLYQRLANSGLGHAKVALAYGVASIGMGTAASVHPGAGLPSLALLILAAGLAGWLVERRLRASGPPVLT
jgi:UDP-N-acetylmuramyl pentapeptide phosphotransferase/UDP-N-acetylglucosamine-1-phosphate transferase